MTQRSLSMPAPMADDELIRIARRYRKESIATLITICRDEHSSSASRAAAASKLLEYSDGKPGQSRTIAVADLATMSDDLRQQLLEALLNHYQPNGYLLFVQETMRQCIDDAMAQASLPAPKKCRFKRGPGAAPHIPRWPAPTAPSISHEQQAELGPEAYAATAEAPPAPAGPVFRGAGDDTHARRLACDDPANRRLLAEPPDNVVVMPGVARPPSVSAITTYRDDSQAAPGSHGTGHIHPSVLLRSAQLDPWRRG
jgi:hypothetical protein